MSTFPKEKIKVIAEELDCGFCVYVHRQTHDFFTMPDTNQHPMIDDAEWREERLLLRKHPDEYFEIEPWDSSHGFKVMADFAENLDDNEDLQNELIQALRGRDPFRAFKDVIDDSGHYRQQWFDYKAQRLEQYVEQQLEYLTERQDEV